MDRAESAKSSAVISQPSSGRKQEALGLFAGLPGHWVNALSQRVLLTPLDGALQALSVAITLLALGLLAERL
jgi:hypothetical protein